MPFPKLSPLQSRLAASIIASFTLIVLYFTISAPRFAYAADVDTIWPEDHNYQRLQGPFLDVEIEEIELRETDQYEGDFLGLDSGIIGRVALSTDPEALNNNIPITDNVVQGVLKSYSFLKASVYGTLSPATPGLPSHIGRRAIYDMSFEDGGRDDGLALEDEELKLGSRQTDNLDARLVYISVNVCVQPRPILNTTVEPPPQLQLYISQSANNTNPGPGKDSALQTTLLLEGGAIMHNVTATDDVYIGIYGENTTAYEDVWSAQIAVSIDGYFHKYHNASTFLSFVDSDNNSGLLYTGNLTNDNKTSPVYEAWMKSKPPFVIFASDKNDRSVFGIQNSYCGMLQSGIGPLENGTISSKVVTSITTRGNDKPRQQFYIGDLSPGTKYSVTLGMFGNSTLSGNNVVGGGGQVWLATEFSTNADGNCEMIFDLEFCDQTAYAVPSNSNNFPNMSSLAAFYDNATQAQYKFFENSLAQIPCEATASAQFSLARTCENCSTAYKEWLCSVSIPRCTDFSTSSDHWWLQERNMIQPFPNGTLLPSTQIGHANTTKYLSTSRNPNIDAIVKPGPYKEILPCENLCYGVVQSCPAAFGFGCPQPGQTAFNQSYGIMPDVAKYPSQNNQITCNYPGATHTFASFGSRIPAPSVMLIALVAMSLMIL